MVHRISRLPKRRGFLGLLSDTRGSELLEMAFGLPLLLVFMVGIADFGGAYNLKHRLSNAVREGARFAASESRLDEFSNGSVCSCTPRFGIGDTGRGGELLDQRRRHSMCGEHYGNSVRSSVDLRFLHFGEWVWQFFPGHRPKQYRNDKWHALPFRLHM